MSVAVAAPFAKGESETWWAFRPLRDYSTPKASEWAKTPIDSYIEYELKQSQLVPNPVADRRDFIRRVSYDLLGLPPSAELVTSFEADESLNVEERLIDRLLASPHFGEQWGRHWLDVVRFGESRGFEVNPLIENAWPFRDYIIRSFNDDKPYDHLVREHLAGDVIGAGDPEIEVGTGFLVAGPDDLVGNQDPKAQAQIRANTLDDIVGATSSAFLGLTVSCARCHDHKFDPIEQADYYRMQATFAGVHHGERVVATEGEVALYEQNRAPILKEQEYWQRRLAEEEKRILDSVELPKSFLLPRPSHYGTEDSFDPVMAKSVRLTVHNSELNASSPAGSKVDEIEVWTEGREPRNVALEAEVRATSKIAVDNPAAYGPQWVNDGKFGQHWITDGNAVLTLTWGEPVRVSRVLLSSDRPRNLDPTHGERRFIGDYRLDVSLDGMSWTPVTRVNDRPPVSDAHARQRRLRLAMNPQSAKALREIGSKLAQARARLRAIPAPKIAWAGVFSQPATPAYLMKRGDPAQRGAEIAPASLTTLQSTTARYSLPLEAPEAERRRALAEWIVQTDNPLTPRVLANRLWYYHFGTGIVDTPSDFGHMGGKPSHPQLLDFLATRLYGYQWHMKPLHRLILTSAVYQQSSERRKEALSVDAQARLLWRFPPRRLRGEEVRDTLLMATGQLDKRQGGPGFRLYKYLRDNVATYVPLERPGAETYRRAVYHQNARAAPVDVLSDFDAPDCALVTPRRVTTTTPLQALTLMNHGFLLDQAALFAQILFGRTPTEQVREAFSRAFQRQPEEDELRGGLDLLEAHGAEAFCRVLLNANELIYLD